MLSHVFVLLLLGAYQLQACESDSDEDDDSTLTYKNTDEEGLLWPIIDPLDYGMHLPHGAHCLSKVVHTNKNHPRTKLGVYHRRHCVESVKLMDKFFDENPQYTVSEKMCNNIIHFMTGGECPDPTNYKPCLTEMRRQAESQKGYNRARDPYSKYGGSILGPQELRGQAETDSDSADRRPKTQQQKFMDLAGRNFFLIFVKEMAQKRKLNKAEKEYLAKWRTPQAVEALAQAVYCSNYGNVAFLKKALAGATVFDEL